MTYNKERATPSADIQEDEILLIRSSERPGYRRRLRVVQFTINGTAHAPKIDNRLYKDNDDNPRGRTVSLDFADAESIVKNWDQIRQCWLGK